jgi:two-component system phosphate regulon response regulator OmpR
MTKRPKILLVEDDPHVREVTQVLLGKYFEVVSAASFTEATSRIDAQHFDVLLTDLHLSGEEDGLSLVNVMRQAQPKAMTVLVSGSAVDAELDGDLQADAVMEKPYEVEELADRIRQYLQSR